MTKKYDFSGWATRNNLKCSDGRVIMKDAFKDNDGTTVPLVWNHQYNEPQNVLGHALLENRDDGVFAYCQFNDTDGGQTAKRLVEHGDISALSIHANQLKQKGSNVFHGMIREVSLVLAGANPGAYIESVISHGEESEEEAIIYTGESLYSTQEGEFDFLSHADDKKKKDEFEDKNDDTKDDSEEDKDSKDDEETVEDVFNSMNDKQKAVVGLLVEQALEERDDEEDEDEDDKSESQKEEDKDMKHNVFDTQDDTCSAITLTHADQEDILNLAKSSSCGSFQAALSIYAENHKDSLSHGIDDIETLFPEYKDVYPGAPEKINRDQGWVTVVMNKTHKSPISRIRTRQADIRDEDIRAYGYVKGDEKAIPPNIKLLKRTTDPQTVYRKDKLDRDDIIDITDFDVVSYMHDIMRENLNEELATAVMIGDGRDDGADYKIEESHIRSIWNDDELYCIHQDVDVEAARKEIQGSNTDAFFGENYIYAEAIITAALYSREKYKGKGTPDFYCTPHLLNVMLLAKDLNGRRIYSNKTDLAAALDVGEIYTAEQFEGKTRVDANGDTKKLLGIFVNLDNYSLGSTKGGEITSFNQFDIDFNQEKYLIETRLSGALTRVFSAIALEEPVTKENTTEP